MAPTISLIAQGYCASRASRSAIVPKYNIALRKNGPIWRQPEEAVRGENEFELWKYEACDGLAVRSAHGISADELLSNVVAGTEPGCASTGRAGGASTADGER